MDRLHIFITLLLGAVASSEVQIRPGDNITLYCDCKASTGVHIMWYRNCSHVNQPSLVLSTRFTDKELLENLDSKDFLNPFPRFHLVKNQSSESYDLLIMNITDSDEGLYYCGKEKRKVEDNAKIVLTYVYEYGNTRTRIRMLDSTEPHQPETQDCDECWLLLFSLCPAFAILPSLLSSLLVYHFCQKTAKEPQADEKRPTNRGHTTGNQDEDVCYAALEIRQASQRPKKKKTTKISDTDTYSAIRM